MGPGESQEQPWQVEREDGDGQRRLVTSRSFWRDGTLKLRKGRLLLSNASQFSVDTSREEICLETSGPVTSRLHGLTIKARRYGSLLVGITML